MKNALLLLWVVAWVVIASGCQSPQADVSCPAVPRQTDWTIEIVMAPGFGSWHECFLECRAAFDACGGGRSASDVGDEALSRCNARQFGCATRCGATPYEMSYRNTDFNRAADKACFNKGPVDCIARSGEQYEVYVAKEQ